MPYPKRTTAAAKKLFVAELRRSGNVSGASRAAGFTRANAYVARREDPGFAAAWDDAIEDAVEMLEEEARRRAHDGTDEPVFHQGKQCGVIRKYSDSLLIFLLKGHRPEKYRERQQIEIKREDLTRLTHEMGKAVEEKIRAAVADDETAQKILTEIRDAWLAVEV